MRHYPRIAAFVFAVLPALTTAQSEMAPEVIQKFVQGPAKAIVTDIAIITAVKEQNARNKTVTQTFIDAVDNDWKTEFKSAGPGKIISAITDNDVSEKLRKYKASHGDLIREMFVMDAKGLNVGAAEPTSDYWQGDEDKWKKTFLVGPDAVFTDKVKFDESSGQSQAQISVTIKDPDTQKAIGAVTFGVNVGAMK